jgi:hypothetical protein
MHMTDRIPIYAVITPSHRVLYERFFLPSLNQDQFDLHALDLEQEGKGEFLADDFKRCILFKLEQIIASIKRHEGTIIVWSDVDIQFFGLTASKMLAPFLDKDLLFAVQKLARGRNDACGGFYAIKCNQQTLAFFEIVLQTTIHETNGNEQDAINLLLQKAGAPKWEFLGPEFYARTHGVWLPKSAVIHHATCIVPGDAVAQKTQLLEGLVNFHQWSITRRFIFRISSSAKAILRKLGLRTL